MQMLLFSKILFVNCCYLLTTFFITLLALYEMCICLSFITYIFPYKVNRTNLNI